MTRMLEPMIGEIQQEAATTKRVLERVPADKLSWKPHPKSMSLGQLALHVASSRGLNPPPAEDGKEILSTLDASMKAAEEYLCSVSDSAALGTWHMT